jgi:hypothetical protein
MLIENKTNEVDAKRLTQKILKDWRSEKPLNHEDA